MTADFFNISDPKSALENCLTKFACLTKGDVITINYQHRLYSMMVLDLKPKDADCIIECESGR